MKENKNYDSKTLKKIVRRLRADLNHRPRLVHLLINIKSRYSGPYLFYKSEKKVLLNKSLDREYGIWNQIVSNHTDRCFEPIRYTRKRGNRTYFKDGKFYTYNPDFDNLPF